MNERIRELINQSYLNVQSQSGRDITYFDKEKFAELIVRECAELMYGRDENGNCKDGDVIKQHFGVEE